MMKKVQSYNESESTCRLQIGYVNLALWDYAGDDTSYEPEIITIIIIITMRKIMKIIMLIARRIIRI
jgi:hypothetical protein